MRLTWIELIGLLIQITNTLLDMPEGSQNRHGRHEVHPLALRRRWEKVRGKQAALLIRRWCINSERWSDAWTVALRHKDIIDNSESSPSVAAPENILRGIALV
jgi:hypothetical protein